MSRYTSPPLKVAAPADGFRRADLAFTGLEHAGRSFEARVFINNPEADERADRSDENGYAGAFHVYGYGRPVPETGPALLPLSKRITATDAVRRALAASDELTVTVATVPADIPLEIEQTTVLLNPD